VPIQRLQELSGVDGKRTRIRTANAPKASVRMGNEWSPDADGGATSGSGLRLSFRCSVTRSQQGGGAVAKFLDHGGAIFLRQ